MPSAATPSSAGNGAAGAHPQPDEKHKYLRGPRLFESSIVSSASPQAAAGVKTPNYQQATPRAAPFGRLRAAHRLSTRLCRPSPPHHSWCSASPRPEDIRARATSKAMKVSSRRVLLRHIGGINLFASLISEHTARTQRDHYSFASACS